MAMDRGAVFGQQHRGAVGLQPVAGGATIALGNLEGEGALNAVSFAQGAVTVSLGIVAAEGALNAVTVAPAPQTVVLDNLAGEATLLTPTLTPGGVTLALGVVEGEGALLSPTLTIGAVNLVIGNVEGVGTLNDVTVGAFTVLALGNVAGEAALNDVSLSIGAVTLAIGNLEAIAEVLTPTLQPGGVTLAIGNVEGLGELLTPTLDASVVLVLGNLVGEGTLNDVTLQVGAVVIALDNLVGEGALNDVAVVDLTNTIQLPTLEGTGELLPVLVVAAFDGIAGDLDVLVARILSIVARLGKPVEFTEKTGDAYDPTTGTRAAGSEATYTETVTPPGDYREYFRNREVLENGDMQIGLPASGLGFTPTTGMKVRVDGETWKIVAVEKVMTGQDLGLYILNLRGGSARTGYTTPANTGLDAALLPKILAIVNRLGKEARFTIRPSRTYTESTGTMSKGLPFTRNHRVTPPEVLNELAPRALLQDGDVQVGLPASGLDFEPVPGTEVSIDGEAYRVAEMEAVYTGSRIGLYVLNLKGGA